MFYKVPSIIKLPKTVFRISIVSLLILDILYKAKVKIIMQMQCGRAPSVARLADF